jgi:transcription antitermination factor NusG
MSTFNLSAERCWHAITVTHKHERAVCSYLQNKGFDGFCPLYKARHQWSDRTKEVETCLFPGYTFSRFAYDERVSILNTPGVISIVSFGRVIGVVDEVEIAAIKAILCSGLPLQPWPYLRVGQKVRIERGCLEGLEGILVRRRDECRVVVSVEILERSVAVEIDQRSLGPIRVLNPRRALDAAGSDRIPRLAQSSWPS